MACSASRVHQAPVYGNRGSGVVRGSLSEVEFLADPRLCPCYPYEDSGKYWAQKIHTRVICRLDLWGKGRNSGLVKDVEVEGMAQEEWLGKIEED